MLGVYMDALVEKLNVAGLDKPRFLLYLNNVMLEEPLPEGYQLGEDFVAYRALYCKIMRALYLNAFKCDVAAFGLIK